MLQGCCCCFKLRSVLYLLHGGNASCYENEGDIFTPSSISPSSKKYLRIFVFPFFLFSLLVGKGRGVDDCSPPSNFRSHRAVGPGQLSGERPSRFLFLFGQSFLMSLIYTEPAKHSTLVNSRNQTTNMALI